MVFCYDDCPAKTLKVMDEDRVKLSILKNSIQEKDITLPLNFEGMGRIKTFRRYHENWNDDPLPTDPICRFFGYPQKNEYRVQVLQLSLCNFNCWYCFVDEALRQAGDSKSLWLSIDELIDYIQKSGIDAIDLSGGQPDLAPRWALFVLRELRKRNLHDKVFVWQDDNLSCSAIDKHLSIHEIEELVSNKNYSRVGCFKGYSKASFLFNTRTNASRFDKQFEIFRSLLQKGFNMYAYVTFTTCDCCNLKQDMNLFIKKLQEISYYLPLRTVPLKIYNYNTVTNRLRSEHIFALKAQHSVLQEWNKKMMEIYTKEELDSNICDIKL